jgi:hypothetical protein
MPSLGVSEFDFDRARVLEGLEHDEFDAVAIGAESPASASPSTRLPAA